MVHRFQLRVGHVYSRSRFAWFEKVVSMETDATSLLGMAITSCAMASAGVEDANRELLNESLQPYISSLNLLQAAFTSELAFERETLHAALLLSMYEVCLQLFSNVFFGKMPHSAVLLHAVLARTTMSSVCSKVSVGRRSTS